MDILYYPVTKNNRQSQVSPDTRFAHNVPSIVCIMDFTVCLVSHLIVTKNGLVLNLRICDIDYQLLHTETDLQVDDGAELAEMFVEFADVVEFRGNLPNQQLCVQVEWGSLVIALVVGFVKAEPEQRREFR